MPRFLMRASALALAFVQPLHASEPATRAQALEAIRTFEANAAGSLTATRPAEDKNDAVARASNTILRYSLESSDVVVDLGADSVPWCDVKKGMAELSNPGERGLLLAAYLCGSVKAQLQTGKQDPNPLAGWVAMLQIYRALKIREGVTIPEVEALLVRQADGTLESYAAAAVQRSTEKLQKMYGSAGEPSKKTATVPPQP